MSRVKIGRRLYLTADRSRAVPADDPDARFLLCTEGGEIDRGEAARLGLLDEPEKGRHEPDKAAAPSAGKAGRRPADKSRRPAANKGADG